MATLDSTPTLAWSVATVVSTTFLIVCDALQQFEPSFPLTPTLAFSFLLLLTTPIAVAVVGKRMHGDCFRCFQPFGGGATYVAIQGVGYTAWAIALLCIGIFFTVRNDGGKEGAAVAALNGGTPRVSHGPLACAGVLGFVANFLLLISLRKYDPETATHPRTAFESYMAKSPNAETVLLFLLALTLATLSAISTYVVPVLGRIPLLMVLSVLHIACAMLNHFVIGWRHTKGYHLFITMQGRAKDTIAQITVWVLFAAALYVLFGLWVSDGMLGFRLFGALATGSHFGLALHIRTSTFGVEKGYHTMAAIYGPSMITAAALIQGLLIAFITEPDLIELFPGVQEASQFGGVLSNLAAYNGGYFLSAIPAGAMNAWVMLTAVLLLMWPVLTHFLGVFVHGGEYPLWSPFNGSVPFILLQAVGWTLFALSTLITVIFLGDHNQEWILLSAVGAVGAQCCLHASVKIYQPPTPSETSVYLATSSCALGPRRTSFQEPLERSASSTFDATQKQYANGELLTAGLLSFSSLVVLVVCDFLQHDQKFPLAVMHVSGAVLFMLAAPLAQLSGRDKFGLRSMLRPFNGTVEYAALQAVGWMTYAMLLVFVLIFVVSSHLFPSPIFGGVAATSTSSIGAFTQLPFWFIAASIYLEFRAQRQRGCSPDVRFMGHLSSEVLEELTPDDITELHALIPKLQSQKLRCFLRSSLQLERRKSARKGGSTHEVETMGLTVVVLSCIVDAVLFTAAATARINSFAAESFVLAGSAVIGSVGVSLSIHMIFAPTVIPNYKLWQPFAGGPIFVALQACGFAAVFTEIVLAVGAMFATSVTGGTAVFAACAVLSVVSQGCLYLSIGHFNVTKKISEEDGDESEKKSLLEEHSEGALSLLLLFGSSVLTFVHDSWDPQSSLAFLPLFLSFTALALAAPLAGMAISRSLAAYRASRTDLIDGMDETIGDLLAQPSRRHHKSHVKRTGKISKLRSVLSWSVEGTTVLLYLFLPFSFCYGGYCLVDAYSTVLLSIMHSTGAAVFGSLVALYIFLSLPTAIFYAKALWSYAVPALTVITLVLWNVVRPTMESHATTANVLAFSFFPPVVRPLMVIGNVLLGSYMFNDYWIQFQSEEANWVYLAARLLETLFVGSLNWCYYCSYLNQPEENGRLQSEKVVRTLRQGAFKSTVEYFKFRVISEEGRLFQDVDRTRHDGMGRTHSSPSLKPKQRQQYMFGFHPHGILPGTAMWCHHTQPWIETVGDGNITTHGANIIFQIPFLRDTPLRIGGRVVTKSAIITAINQGNSPVVVPGGQAEMILSYVSEKKLTLVTRHVGFIRIAIQHRLPLVPILVFGEHNLLDNVHCESIQQWFLKYAQVGFPVFPMGVFRTPLPNRRNLTMVLGKPIDVPKWLDTGDHGLLPPQAEAKAVDEVCDNYYAELKRVFYKHREEAGYPKMELVLEPRKRLHDGPQQPHGHTRRTSLPGSQHVTSPKQRKSDRNVSAFDQPSSKGVHRRGSSSMSGDPSTPNPKKGGKGEQQRRMSSSIISSESSSPKSGGPSSRRESDFAEPTSPPQKSALKKKNA